MIYEWLLQQKEVSLQQAIESVAKVKADKEEALVKLQGNLT